MRHLMAAVLLLLALVPGSASAQNQQPHVLKQLLAEIHDMTEDEALAMGDRWLIPGWLMQCVGAPGTKPRERAVLLCNWSKGGNIAPEGHAILWREGGQWKSQPYPREALRGKAYFRRVYQSGTEIIAILDVAPTFTRYAEQPQLLRRINATWQMVWLPKPDQWSSNSANVSFPGGSFDWMTVDTDRHVLNLASSPFNPADYPVLERWKRRGNQHERVSRTEPPTAPTTLMHFATALANGDMVDAQRWASASTVVQQAIGSGFAKMSRIGFSSAQMTDRTPQRVRFLVKAANYEQTPQWSVTLHNIQGRWLVNEVTQAPTGSPA